MNTYQKLSLIGIDLGKNCFHLHGADKRGKQIFQRKLKRDKLLGFLSELDRKSVIAFESCGGAHHLARHLMREGFEVRMMAAQFVSPYRKSNKNDFRDAEAICEAASRPSMRFVGVKSAEQQEIQMIHRIRARVTKNRTAVVNEMRGFLMEIGIVLPKGITHARRCIPSIVSNGRLNLSSRMRKMLSELYDELCLFDEQIKSYDKELRCIAQASETCRRLLSIKGVGPITATALYACTSPRMFKNGRQFAASLGLVPKQDTTGGKPRLLGISKRGDSYTRQLLVHGGRSVVRVAKSDDSKYGRWVQGVKENTNFKKASVAVANKNARIAWVLLTTEEEFNPEYEQQRYKKAA